MEIAPGIHANAWNELNLDAPTSEDWPKAIGIFRERIEKRYLLPTKHLICLDEPKPPYERTLGFSVMALNCLLTETLQSFVEGVPDTRGKSQELITTFLTTSAAFSPPFDAKLAHCFYRDVRCGILHIGETQRDARVWSVGPLVVPYKNSITINRTTFFERLEAAFHRYRDELTDADGHDLRERFRAKMDYVARKQAAQ